MLLHIIANEIVTSTLPTVIFSSVLRNNNSISHQKCS